jgi:hypothetical protein
MRPAIRPINFVAQTPQPADNVARNLLSTFVRESRGAERNRRWAFIPAWRADIGHIERELAEIQSVCDRERAQGIELRAAQIVLRDQYLVEGGSLENFLERGNRAEHRISVEQLAALETVVIDHAD